MVRTVCVEQIETKLNWLIEWCANIIHYEHCFLGCPLFNKWQTQNKQISKQTFFPAVKPKFKLRNVILPNPHSFKYPAIYKNFHIPRKIIFGELLQVLFSYYGIIIKFLSLEDKRICTNVKIFSQIIETIFINYWLKIKILAYLCAIQLIIWHFR